MSHPTLEWVAIADIVPSPRNPRSDADVAIEDLAASFGSNPEAPMLAQPPLVQRMVGGTVSVVAGERRVRAAQHAGVERLACLVYENLDPLDRQTLSMLENLHRRDLHPLDEAIALKLSWCCENARAVGLGREAQDIAGRDTTPQTMLQDLLALLDSCEEFSEHKPAVSWDQLITRFGLHVNKDRRRRLIRLLSLDRDVQSRVRDLHISDAGLRAIGTLDAETQRKLIAEIEDDPALASRARRIARTVREGTYTLQEAVNESKGVIGTAELPAIERPVFEPTDELVTHAVLNLVEIAYQFVTAATNVSHIAPDGNLGLLQEPWSNHSMDACAIVRSALDHIAPVVEE